MGAKSSKPVAQSSVIKVISSLCAYNDCLSKVKYGEKYCFLHGRLLSISKTICCGCYG